MSLKDTRIIDLNLFSGSSELMRQSVGGHYYNSETGVLEFRGATLTSPIQIDQTITSELKKNITKIIPNYTYATRIVSDPSNSDIVSDENWKNFIIGGKFGEKEYQGIYNENIYLEHYNTSPLPIMPREIVNTSEQPSLTLTTEYYNYYPRFQTEVNNLDSALMSPNFYLIDDSLLGYITDKSSSAAKYQYQDIKNFLTNDFVNSEKTYDNTLENIFALGADHDFDLLTIRADPKKDDGVSGQIDLDLQKLYSLMPFGNKLEISADLAGTGGSEFRNLIGENNYEVKFIKLLKEVFQGESALQTSTVNFAVNTDATISTGIATGSIQSTSTLPVKLVDVPTMLLYAYRNPNSETNNISLLSSSAYSSQIEYAFDTVGIHRYENTEASLKVFDGFIKEMGRQFLGEPHVHPLENFLNQANVSKYHETVAFRIQKIGGPPTGDYNTENTIQNIWFYNRDSAFTYFDTQVKYDTEYTYKIYKYVIVQGYKYQLSDVITTRQIAVTPGETDVYCLEFYDPYSGQATGNLLDSDSIGPLEQEYDLAQQKLETYQSWVDILDFEINTVLGTLISALGSSIYDLDSGLDYTDTTVFSDFIKPILTTYFDYFVDSTDPGFPKIHHLPYLPRTETLPNGYGLVGLEEITYSTIRAYGIDAVTIARSSTPTPDLAHANIDQPSSNMQVFKDQVDQIVQTLGGIRDNIRDNLASDAANEVARLEALITFTSTREFTTDAQINSSYPYLADLKITIEPSLKVIEMPLEEKRMRIVDHPPNDFVVTPHHLLDQTNRLAFYCKYDTFTMNSLTYPPSISAQDEQNRSAYLEGHDLLDISKQTQESISRPRFIEVYRTTTKPTGYDSFAGNLRRTIDLRQTNGDMPTDHLFVERVRENIKYYYVFRALNENRVAGQMSPVFEAELVNDGGYVYGAFEQFSEDDLMVSPPKEPLMSMKKLLNIIPNIQHLQLDTSAVSLAESSESQLSLMSLGSNAEDTLWDPQKYYKIRLTSKKTGKKVDLNISFEKKERK